jgi:RES domain-containing protein
VSGIAVWRLCAAKYAATAFDGEGARRFGGRWSSPGRPAIYCSESRALAALEVLAHVDTAATLSLASWVHVAGEIPAGCIGKPERFPASWRQFPHSAETRHFGDAWLDSVRTAALRVPSAFVAGEFNYLLNPRHPDFPRIAIGRSEPFAFDPRLL